MYFIQKIVKHIWGDTSKVYQEHRNKYLSMDKDVLYQELSKQQMSQIYYPGLIINSLASCGCRYRFQNKQTIIGCSMCDYQSEFAPFQAAMEAIRLKDKKLYAYVVKKSFENVRGIKPDPEPFEVITGYNFFDEMEFPDEVLHELFKEGNLFSKRPYMFVFEGRASDINEKRLELLKSLLPEKSRVAIEFGVEARDEWIRNHWINKGVTDKQIIHAISKIHNVGFRASGDIIIGIPGLTEQQSIDQYVQTAIWLDTLGIDEIVCLPLNRKKHTLQGFLHQKLRQNPVLTPIGLAQEEHTGVIWLYTILNALVTLYRERPEIIKKLNLAQLSPDNNVIGNTMAYNTTPECECNQEILYALRNFSKSKDIKLIQEMIQKSLTHACYQDYQSLLELQERAGDVKSVMRVVAQELAKCVFEDWDSYYQDFCLEMKKLKSEMI